jgi:hypothetical protein
MSETGLKALEDDIAMESGEEEYYRAEKKDSDQSE